mgnify:CR=1 FL=1
MAAILGIDIGTSSAKVMLLDAKTGEQWVQAQAYDVSTPQTGWAEQNPELWWQAVRNCLALLKAQHGKVYRETACIGLSGQMHGLVLADGDCVPVRPAILWNDQRSGEECELLRRLIPEDLQRRCLKNRIFPGFALPSLLWVQRHEPEIFAGAKWVMQPKDYVRSRLTGCVGAEVSDASASLLFDLEKRDWAWEILERCGVSDRLFPECHESWEIQGTVSKECASLTGLPETAQVIYGMGDQQAQSIGNGVLHEGTFICNIGTGGQISSYSEKPVSDSQLRTQTFCHGLPGAYTVYGAVLNAGMSLKWLKDQVLRETDGTAGSSGQRRVDFSSVSDGRADAAHESGCERNLFRAASDPRQGTYGKGGDGRGDVCPSGVYGNSRSDGPSLRKNSFFRRRSVKSGLAADSGGYFPQGSAGLPGKGAGMSWRVHAGGDRGWNLWGYQRGCPEPCDLRPGSLSPGSGTCGTIQETV